MIVSHFFVEPVICFGFHISYEHDLLIFVGIQSIIKSKANKMRLKNCFLVVAAFSMIMGIFSCTQKVEKEIGIQLWSVREDMKADPAGTIAKLGEIGYSFVEAAGYHDGKFYGMAPADFKALVEANGMTLKSSHTGAHLPDSALWDETMAWWDKCIAAHKEAGVTYLVKPSLGRHGFQNLDTLKMYCDYFNIVGEKCNKAGIRFGFHNHANEFTTVLDGQIVQDFMIQNTDPDKVMFQLDLYWIKEGGKEALEYFKKYPGRFEMYHVKDKKEVGESGTMDFKSAFDNAQLAGMKDYVVEVEDYNFEPIESVAKSYEYLMNAEYVTR